MAQFTGAIVEKVVRRSGISIAELARRVDINRRSIYNWFEQESLSIDIICKIGNALDYDFSADFPELFANHNLSSISNRNAQQREAEVTLNYWKNKYISLLEKYNELLQVEKIKKNAVSKESAA